MSPRARTAVTFAVVSTVSLIAAARVAPVASASRSTQAQAQVTPTAAGRPGSTTTRLPDGRWLVVGGVEQQGPVAAAAIVDPRDGRTTPISSGLQQARTAHTATLLADGTVLIVGGRGAGDAIVATPELFDPATATFTPLAVEGAGPRAEHTATLLTDGRILIADGIGADGRPLGDAQIWDLSRGTTMVVTDGLVHARSGQRAELLADGRVLIAGGVDANGAAVAPTEIIDPATLRSVEAPAPAEDETVRIAESMPPPGALDVALDVRIALRFSHPMRPETVTPATLTLAGTDGLVDLAVVVAEGGRLAFVSPRLPLHADSAYSLTIAGAIDAAGVPLQAAPIGFVTVANRREGPPLDEESWTPSSQTGPEGWRSNRAQSPWQALAPLQAPPGVTAVAGQVLRLDGRPLPDVTLRLEGRTAHTDRTGRFLLLADGVTTGEHTLAIDATTASRPNRTYGFYEARITVKAGVTTALPFTIWSPALDTAHAVTIASPTTAETVVTTPTMPGLELHLPAGTVIRGEDGKVVKTLTMTPMPLDRTPFPLPADAMFTMFFTIQPGGAYVETPGPIKGAWLVYPRRTAHMVGARLRFYNYDPDDKGWFAYGLGTVTATQVVPDAKTRVYAFTGASFDSGGTPAPGPTASGSKTGDPVDPSTGAFVMEKTDLYVPDVMPLALTRTYNSLDNDPGNVRPFGIGMTHTYGVYQWSAQNGQFLDGDFIQPDGSRIHYVAISGTGLQTVFECQAAPTPFYKSRLSFAGNIWTYQLKDGTQYLLGHSAALQAIRDRYGNETRLTWSGTNIFGVGVGNILRITSPNGRWIELTYDTNPLVNRITQAKDNLGRTVSYTYDANGHLSTVTDPEQNVTTYTWDANNRLATIKDGRNIVYLTNHYDANGRLDHQTLADPNAAYSFAYTTDGSGNVTQTDVTDPRGHVKRYVFNTSHYTTRETEALGQPEERTTDFERTAGGNFVSAQVDALLVEGVRRRTEYTYDDSGHLQLVKRAVGTSLEAHTSFTYEPQFFQLATVTDPLQHTWTIGYDAQGHLTSTTDPLTHQTTYQTDIQGRITRITDPLSHVSQIGYTGADHTSTINPVGSIWRWFTDAGGRTLSTTDPLGHTTTFAPDGLNRVMTITNALGGQTGFTYDPNSRMLSLTDALTHTTAYTYDTSNRTETRTDPLLNSGGYHYDLENHLTQVTDRKGQLTSYQYDALDRLSVVTYADSSTTQYVYDAGDRIHQVIDSVAGTITREYDGLDRLTSETTPEGTISYGYDADGRRSTMTVSGQQLVLTYEYDDAHRLTSIKQGTTTVVGFTYDNADRRSTLTLPNGTVITYGFDDANQLTSLTYTLGQTTLGTLTYTYDASGNRTTVGGTWARTGLPEPLSAATYDAANRITTWAGQIHSYDQNGNLTSDGLTSYSWNARNQLVELSGATSGNFQYDGLRRRRSKTIGGATTNFLYDGINLVQELTGGGTPTANLLTGLAVDETFTRTDANGTSTLLADALGSTIELADSSGISQTHYTYDPFGATMISGATTTNSLQFTGRENDATGLYGYRARYHFPGLQRFISEDPIGVRTYANLYWYADDDPINATDPTGFAPVPSNAVYYICCQHHQLGVCKGPAPAWSNRDVDDCMNKHEQQHLRDFAANRFPCDGQKCTPSAGNKGARDGEPVLTSAKGPVECSGSCAELDCLATKFQSPDVRTRTGQVKKDIARYCGLQGCSP